MRFRALWRFAELHVNAATSFPKLDPGPETISSKNAPCDELGILKGFTFELASHIDPAPGSKRAVPKGTHACFFSS